MNLNRYQTCEKLKANLQNILLLKKQKENLKQQQKQKQKQNLNENLNLNENEKKILLQPFLLLASLKEQNRESNLRVDSKRKKIQKLQELMELMDSDLLKNLYKKLEIKQEIKAISKTIENPKIQLIPKEQFIQDKQKEKESESETDLKKLEEKDPHQFLMNRFEYELQEREKHNKYLKNLNEKVENIKKENSRKKVFLNDLQTKLKTLIDISIPIQEFLQIPITEKIQQYNNIACFLSSPLYTLFQSLDSSKEHLQTQIQTEIIGDPQKAKKFSKKHFKALDKLNSTINSMDSLEEGEVKPEFANKSTNPKEKIPFQVENSSIQKNIFKAYPLKLHLKINCNQDEHLLIEFTHFVFLKIVTMKIIQSPFKNENENENEKLLMKNFNSILFSNLFPNDDGNNLPPESESLLIHAKQEYFDIGKYGKPYLWLQWICGIQHSYPLESYLNSNLNSEENNKMIIIEEEQNSQQKITVPNQKIKISNRNKMIFLGIKDLISMIKYRVENLIELKKQIDSLITSNSVSIANNTRTLTKLEKWEQISETQFLSKQFPHLNNSYDFTNFLRNEHIDIQNNLFYQGIFRHSKSNFLVFVMISPKYPESSPRFFIHSIDQKQTHNFIPNEELQKKMNQLIDSSSNKIIQQLIKDENENENENHDNQLDWIEYQINEVILNEIQNKTQILSLQIIHLQVCIDAMIRTEGKLTTGQSQIRTRKGRDRHPFGIHRSIAI
ncbi:fms interacting protein [Anaeramoeba ignava]|uniref:Fms interacting protein n=1 Tax=Anaeramoeba ignava TaxID=1746090 RepID=A0A9Q0LHA5_ANAIG|nr:fms interacting protein [Anaeramoeba ignava]